CRVGKREPAESRARRRVWRWSRRRAFPGRGDCADRSQSAPHKRLPQTSAISKFGISSNSVSRQRRVPNQVRPPKTKKPCPLADPLTERALMTNRCCLSYSGASRKILTVSSADIKRLL